MQDAQIIVAATPVFLLLIVVVFLVGLSRGKNTYRLNDALSSIGLGVMSQLTDGQGPAVAVRSAVSRLAGCDDGLAVDGAPAQLPDKARLRARHRVGLVGGGKSLQRRRKPRARLESDRRRSPGPSLPVTREHQD